MEKDCNLQCGIFLCLPFGSCVDEEIGDTDLSRKISLCYELLDVAEILEPGSSIFRGKLLIDLQEALHVQTKRQLKAKIISLAEAKVGAFELKLSGADESAVNQSINKNAFRLLSFCRISSINSWMF